jgi:hypothetical protein
MPRTMANCASAFSKDVDHALTLTKSAEQMRLAAVVGYRFESLHHTQIEYLYELAYLKMFIGWEVFLESSFLRYICGLSSSTHGPETMCGGRTYHRTLVDAEGAMLAGHDYFLWANTGKVLSMVRRHLDNSRHENVIAGSRAMLGYYAAIRHRIAHGQPNAIAKFDDAAMALARRRNFGSRAGRFLRSWDTSATPNLRWIESIARMLKQLAAAIA